MELIIDNNSYFANIYLGLTEGYNANNIHTLKEVREICKQYCSDIGLCVTVTPTEYIYKNGGENGCIIGLINYLKYPKSNEEIDSLAINLAMIFKEKFNQLRISIITKDKTYMLE